MTLSSQPTAEPMTGRMPTGRSNVQLRSQFCPLPGRLRRMVIDKFACEYSYDCVSGYGLERCAFLGHRRERETVIDPAIVWSCGWCTLRIRYQKTSVVSCAWRLACKGS